MAIHCMLLTGDNIRIVQNFLSEFKDKYDCMQTFDMVRSMISAWQSSNFKDGEEPTMPTKDEIEQFIQSQLGKDKQSSVTSIRGTYEVSTAGDKRFSALNATFAEGTIIDGVDVSGKTIEYVYQNVIKKSGKGKAPAKDSILNLDGKNLTKEELEDFSYYKGYLPLWQEWARQNPALISELKAKSAGKTLTDKFARTKVSQARALTDILNNFNESEFTRKIDSIDNQITDDMDESDIVNLLVKNGIIEKGYWGILGREIIMANINGVKIPFYRSSNGTSGKKAGKWYQFFGFGNMDSSSKDNDWFIKGSSKNNNEIENGYGSIDIQRLTALFNKYLNWTGKHDKNNMHSVYDFTEKGTEGGNHYFLGPQRTEDINTILYGTKDKDLTGINARKALEERVNMIKANSKALSPVQEYSNEEQSIIDKAKKNGTFMKAPNGKPTNLTEKQWVQVRTKAFKDWFGDWENDPKNASKVVDENGEPLVVYHNSNADINIFDENKIGTNGSSEGGLFGKGFYFSTNKDYNNLFGNKEYAVFLNIKNPITDEITIKEIQAFKPSIDTIKSAYNKDGLIGINESENNTVEYVAYDSNQIKSAINNTGAFSKYSNDIYDTDSKETSIQDSNNLLKNINNVDKLLVDVEQHDKPWKSDPTKSNKTLRVYLKNHSKGYFELVKDVEDNFYSVHFKTAKEGAKYNAENTTPTTKEERKILFKELVKLIPEGAKVSTWGSISDEGIKALDNVGRNMIKVGERTITKKTDGSKVNIPIYQKQDTTSTQEEAPIQEDDKSYAEDLAKCARQMSPIERKHRVERITRMFSSIVNSKLKNKLAAYNDKIQAETNSKVKNDLLFGRKKITRFSVIKSEGVQSIMMEVRKAFQVYADAPLEAKIAIEKQQILSAKPNLNDRIATNIARNVAERKTKAFQNVLNNFQVLAEESLGNLALTEGISVNLNSNFVLNTQENSDTFNEDGKQINQGDVFEKEESLKDGWMTDVRQVATFDSLTARVRQAIGNMVRYDSTGNVDRDDLGDNIYLNAGYVHSELIQALRNMISAEDMIPMLEQLSKKKVWVKQIINELNNDNQLFTEFYRAYRKDYVNYFIQKVSTNSDTSTSTKVMSINGAEGTSHYFDEWRDNYEYGNVLTTDSIYDKNGDIQLKNAKVGLDLVDLLLDIFEDRETIAENLTDENVVRIKKAMNMLGVSVDSETLENALKFNLDNKAFKPAVNVLLSNLRTIYYDLNKGNEKVKDGEYVDLLNIHGTAFNNIAEVINKVDEDTIESSVRQGDKTMYAHINPSYVTTLIKKLQREDTYKQVLDDYRVCNWFNKNGKWRNSILEEIENSTEVRSNLKHVVLLQYNRKEYSAWTDLDATLALYNMYMTGAADRSGSETYGYYQVPMLSDTQSAEFIKFKRYKKGYEEKLLDKFKDLVYQEIDRINLVKERATTKNHIDPIANFDMDNKKMGGAEFKFFPELNQKGQSGKTFLQAIDEAKKISMDEVDNLIKNTIKSIMDSRFNEAVQHYKDIGLYDRIGTEKNARFKYVNVYSEEGMNDRMREWFWNSTYFTSQFIELTTTDLAYYKNLEDFQKRNKQDHAPAERLNTLATWNGKPVLVNNDGSRRTVRRVIYLKDNILPANSMDSINEILEARVKDKNDAFTAYDKAAIMSIFNKVNVADAQAYNTLPSFRSTQIMAGMWSDAEETAYNNIMNNKWTASDFLVLWNTRKPYLYTQKNQPDGMGGIMKVPTQHKNSEFLLLTGAMFGQILHSSKLQALNDFMVKNNIDSAMFESAVKDGLQGTINLNDATNYASTMAVLENATRLNGKENPNVVHEFDYNDYGIQTSTPEHGIDKVQLVGTQIRRLISSDMNPNRDPNFKLKYKDREFTQEEWMNYFNAINTANIQEAFKEVSDKFNDIHEVEKELIREVRSNPRYGTDLIRALTLDENGNFNIPLIDPSQTLRIQALLNSILKNRVTKQKINGGALIQASPFGLDESKQPQIVYNEDGSIKYFEAYLPCPTEELYNALLDPNTHELDINKKDSKGNYIVPEKYREVIGYRV